MNGWIKLHRCLYDKPIWQTAHPEQKVVLITILMLVNHKEKEWIWKGERFTVNSGQMVTSLDSLAKKSGVSVRSVRTALVNFEKLDFLTNVSTKTGRLITVVNWELYQSEDKEPTKKETNDRQSTDKAPTTNKNDKNDKNDKNINYTEFVDAFHASCNTLPRIAKLTDARKKALKRCVSEYGEEEVLKTFTLVGQSSFLTGKTGTWSANIDWILKPANMVKILEGSYADKNNAPANRPPYNPNPENLKFL